MNYTPEQIERTLRALDQDVMEIRRTLGLRGDDGLIEQIEQLERHVEDYKWDRREMRILLYTCLVTLALTLLAVVGLYWQLATLL